MTDKPEIDFPDGPPPADLEITDITVGDGDEAKAGSRVSNSRTSSAIQRASAGLVRRT